MQQKYSNEQLETLRWVSLAEVARRLGFMLKREGTYYRIKNRDVNIVINTAKNKYVDNITGKQGFGAIDFLRDFANYTFNEAINFLKSDYSISNENINTDIIKTPKENKQITEIPVLVEKNLQNIINYLTKARKIDPKIIQDLINKNLLYADKFNNCVFINEAKTFAFLRGTILAKRFVANRGKMDFFKIVNTDNLNQIFLFESVIDALSFMTLYPIHKGIFTSLNGSAMINKLDQLNLKQYQRVYCCFDNDNQGQIFDKKVKEIFSFAIVLKPTKGKDFNDDLVGL